MEDDLNILANGRRPQYFGKLKTTLIFWQMEDNLNILANGIGPPYVDEQKTTSICGQMEDDQNVLTNGICHCGQTRLQLLRMNHKLFSYPTYL